MGQKIAIGLVGCGRIGRRHVTAIQQCEDGHLVSVCDVNQEKARSFSALAGGLPWYSDLGQMLEQESLDALAICTPSGMHPSHATLGASAGLHILCEKPGGLSEDSVNGWLNVCKTKGKRGFLVLQNRFNPAVVALKEAVDAGHLGRICLASASVLWARPQSYFDDADWRGTTLMDGGVLMNQACHYVDLLQWIAGPIEEVHTFGATLARDIQAWDTATVGMRFSQGAVGSIQATVALEPDNVEGSLTVVGTKGVVKIGGQALNRLLVWQTEKIGRQEIQDVVEGHTDVYGQGHISWYREVLGAIAQGRISMFEGETIRSLARALQKMKGE